MTTFSARGIAALRARLEPGDRLDQRTFHARYEAMPDDVKAELIGGVVYMQLPLRRAHGRAHALVMTWPGTYVIATPGTEALDNATTILGAESEPQPDASLIVLPEHGGQARFDEHGYLIGPPELICEVASSSVSYDLHAKKADYQNQGVLEYLVVCVEEPATHWFVRGEDRSFVSLRPDDDGVYRSRVFGGLWLDADALLHNDGTRVLAVLEEGLRAPEHTATVERLRRV